MSEPQKETRCVLVWYYSDHSSFGVVRVYNDDKRAYEDLALVKEDCTRTYELRDVEYFR